MVYEKEHAYWYLNYSLKTRLLFYLRSLQFSSVHFSHSVVSDPLLPHGLQHARLPCPSQTPELKLMSIESMMPSNHLILCHPLLLLPSIFPSIRVFSNESVFHVRWPKYWSFSFSISPSNEYSGLISCACFISTYTKIGLISFRMDWFDFLAVQGILSIFSNTTVQKHQFFGVQLSL